MGFFIPAEAAYRTRVCGPRRAMGAAGVLALILLVVSPLGAELMIDGVYWQWARPMRGQKAAYQNAPALLTVPPGLAGKLRTKVILKNRGPKAVEGIVLRYCIAARLAPLDKKEDGVWAIPFIIEEKRVAKVGPNQLFEVILDPAQSMDLPLKLYLRRVYRSGFWPDYFKIEVMLSPHRGAVEIVKTHASFLQLKK